MIICPDICDICWYIFLLMMCLLNQRLVSPATFHLAIWHWLIESWHSEEMWKNMDRNGSFSSEPCLVERKSAFNITKISIENLSITFKNPPTFKSPKKSHGLSHILRVDPMLRAQRALLRRSVWVNSPSIATGLAWRRRPGNARVFAGFHKNAQCLNWGKLD